MLLLTACPAEEEVDEPTDDDPAAEEWASCTNPAAGYTVQYPQDWHTNEGDEFLDDCQVFDPEPPDLPDQPRDLPLDFGVTIMVEPTTFERIAGEDPFSEILQQDDVEVDGRTAVRQEIRITEDTLIPEGTEFTRYVVDLDGETLIAASYDVGEPAYEEKVEVLDAMVETLELPDGS